MLRLAVAGLRAHRSRLLLAGLAVLIGTAFVSGTLVLGDTLRADVERTVVGNAARIDVAVVANNRQRPLPAALPDRISGLRGVREVQGLVAGDVTVLGRDGRPAGEQPVGFSVTMRTDVVQGRAPATDAEVVLAEQTAENLGYGIGDTVTVLDHADGAPRQLTVSGLVSAAGQGTIALRGGIGFTRPVATIATGISELSEIYVAGTGSGMRDDVDAVVGNGPYSVFTGRQYAERQAASSGVDPAVLATGLAMFALVALLVAAFVIQNTFSVLVTQRRRELALARCVGATRRQVFAGVLAEAAVTGALASAAGLVCGVGGAYGAVAVMNAAGADIPLQVVTVTPLTLGLSTAAGLLSTIAAAVAPARAATRVPPVEALRNQPRGSARRTRARVAAAVVACTSGVAGAAAGVVSDGRQYPLVLVAVGGMLTFVGVVLLGPVLVGPLARVVGRPLGALLGVPGRLGTANAVRNPARAATTVLTMVIGITLITGVSVVTRSLSASVDVGVADALPADYLIVPPGAGVGAAMPRSVASDLRTAEGVTAVTAIREAPVTVGGDVAMLSTTEGAIRPAAVRGSVERIGPGRIALLPERARELGVDVGATLDLTIDGRVVTVEVVAIVAGPAVPRMYVSPAYFEQLFPARGDAAVLVTFERQMPPTASRAVVDAATEAVPTVRIVSTFAARDRLTDTLGQATMVVTGLLAFAVVIALVGIANTMTLSVLERSRESAMLRALGLGRGGLRLMLTAEALIFGVLGGVVGVVLGTGFGLAAARVVNDDVVLSVPVDVLVLVLLAAGLAAVLASLLPVRRVARGSVAEALARP